MRPEQVLGLRISRSGGAIQQPIAFSILQWSQCRARGSSGSWWLSGGGLRCQPAPREQR